MGDHFAFLVNRLLTESTLHAAIESRNRLKQALYLPDEAATSDSISSHNVKKFHGSVPGNLAECRICQDEDLDSNMETPCSCSGSLKYVHRKCVQRWCDEKGDIICEICNQQFKPGYTAPPPGIEFGRLRMNFRGNWEISRRDLTDRHLVEMVSEQSIDSERDDSNPRSLMFSFLAATIFVVLWILRDSLPEVISAAEFLFPFFIVAGLRTLGLVSLACVAMLTVKSLQHHCRREALGNVPELPGEDAFTEQPELQHHTIEID